MKTTLKSAKRIPVIQTGRALQSLRDSGHSLPTAVAEIVDNSIEAGANHVSISLRDGVNSKGKRHVDEIAVADDGEGMALNVLHHYPVIGFSTRYMSTETIGKYGVGAKLAALNFCRRFDVWSRDDAKRPWMHVYFDLDEALNEEAQDVPPGVEPPDEYPVPTELARMLPPETGTLVVWSRIERLEEGRFAANSDQLKVDLGKELSRIFRYYIDGGIKIDLTGLGPEGKPAGNEVSLVAHDPLMLLHGSWSDKVLSKHHSDEKDGHFPARVIADEPVKAGKGEARLRVTLYPKEVLRKRFKGGDSLAKELRVPDNQGSLSFVRLDREVAYTNVPRILPQGVQDPDRFIGIEVSFRPDLDEFFGIRNVKRGVEPHGELRATIRKRLDQHIAQARKLIEEHWGEVARKDQSHKGEHAAVMDAVKEANRLMPKSRTESVGEEEAKRKFEDLARDVLGDEAEDEAKKQEYFERIKGLPFVVESVDFPGNMFIMVDHINNQVIIRLNTRHRFYREMWEPIKDISQRTPGTVSGDEAVKTARRTLEALELLIIAYGKSESMHTTPTEHYADLKMYWGQFLETLLGKVKGLK